MVMRLKGALKSISRSPTLTFVVPKTSRQMNSSIRSVNSIIQL